MSPFMGQTGPHQSENLSFSFLQRSPIMRDQERAELEEDVLESVWQRLELRRLELAAEASDLAEDFYIQVRGGAWTARHHGNDMSSSFFARSRHKLVKRLVDC